MEIGDMTLNRPKIRCKKRLREYIIEGSTEKEKNKFLS